FSISVLSMAAALKLNESLCSDVFSNCGPSSCNVVFRAFEANTLISAQCAAPAAKTANTMTCAATSARFILMASSRDRCFVAARNRMPAADVRRASLAVHAGDGQEFVGLEAGPAHQRTVDVGHAQELLGIRGLDRAAVEN